MLAGNERPLLANRGDIETLETVLAPARRSAKHDVEAT
jgi:hypothetical protein